MSEAVGDELRKIKENLRIEIKALLCSSKDGLSERELKNEYRQIIGVDIPYARLGYRCLYDLMCDMPTDVQIRRHKDGYTWIYYGIHDETTRDLGQLVSGQLDKSKGVRDMKRARENRFRSPRLFGGAEVNTMPMKQILPSILQTNIEKILRAAPKQKLTLKEFEHEYINRHVFMFNYKLFGYNTIKEALESLTHLIQMQSINNNDFQVCLLVASQQETTIEESDKTMKKIQYVTLEEEILFNLVKLIEEQGEEGVILSQLPTLYKEKHNISLKYERFGFSSFDDFVYAKLEKKVQFIQPKEKYSEIKLLSQKFKVKEDENSIENSDLKMIIDKKKNEKTSEEKLKSLKKYIRVVFGRNYTKKILVDDFPRIFELKNGWNLNPKEYDTNSFDELYKKLCELNIINMIYSTGLSNDHNNNNDHQIHSYLMLYKNSDEICGSDLSKFNETLAEEAEEKEKTKEEKRLIQAKFMLDYVFYNNEFDYADTLKPLTIKDTHIVRVSNVSNPVDLQIHLIENINSLNELMDELETLYHGIGSSSYDMPAEYIILGRVCVAIYPGDNNWHRCLITGVLVNENKCRVEFIDYGGSAYVPMNGLKFLDKRFAELPIQAINARLHNVKEPENGKWHKDIINYLLNLTIRKDFKAKIYGFNEGKISIELLESTENGMIISLNRRVIQSSYGSWCDSTQDIDYEDYDTWRDDLVAKKKCMESDVVSSTSNTTEGNNNNHNNDFYDLTDPQDVLRRKEKKLEQFSLRSLLSSVNEITDSSNTDEITRSSKSALNRSSHLVVKYKTTALKFLDLNTEMQIYLFQINNEKIFLHSSDVMKLFGLSSFTFKLLLQQYRDKNEYLEIFKYDEYNKKLFSLVEKDLKLDTKLQISDTDREIIMISYKNIVEFAGLCLGHEHGKRVENCLNHRKQRARKHYADCKQLYNEDKLDNKTRADNFYEMAASIHNDGKILREKLRSIDRTKNKDDFEKAFSAFLKNEERYNHYMSLYLEELTN